MRPLTKAALKKIPLTLQGGEGGEPMRAAHALVHIGEGANSFLPRGPSRLPQRGFTLIEMVMVIIVLSVLTGLGANLLASGFRAYFMGQDLSEGNWHGRVAMERMTRELREARAPADLTIVPATEITFIRSDNVAVRYCLAGVGTCPAGPANTLMRISGPLQDPLADNISALDFTYLQGDGVNAPIAPPADVRYVTVAVTVTLGDTNFILRDTIRPRSFP